MLQKPVRCLYLQNAETYLSYLLLINKAVRPISVQILTFRSGLNIYFFNLRTVNKQA